MKNKINNKLILLSLFVLMVQTSLKAQWDHCDTCTYTVRHNQHLDSFQKVNQFLDDNNTAYYPFCDSTPKRNVAFVHGLGGSNQSWPKQVDFTDTAYNTASFAISYAGYENSFDAVASQLNTELSIKLNNGINTLYPNRCKKQDYVIAHSQGGIASRYLDYKWDVSTSGTYGTRNFYGLVTFGTPNAGADIVLSQDQHADFVQQMISTIVLGPLNEKVYDLTDKFGSIVGAKLLVGLTSLDSFIKQNMVPLMLSGLHTATMKEMKPGSITMNTIENHNSKLHRAAFYGIEDAPECWRVIDNTITKEAADYPLWGAQPDNDFKNNVEKVRLNHIVRIAEHKAKIKKVSNTMRIPFYGMFRGWIGGSSTIRTQRKLIVKRETSVTFLDNANTQWRYLIGSYHRDSFEGQATIVGYSLSWEWKYANGWISFNKTFRRHSDALAHSNYLSNRGNPYNIVRNMLITPISNTVRVRKFFPSDGVVLAKSQKAYPKVRESDTDEMPHNNHFQERNSEETERILKNLYNGGTYDRFFQLKP